jgi:hypothetical protein
MSKIEVISDAFILLGKAPVNSIGSDASPVVASVSKLYDLIYPMIITMHTWRFAMAFKTLSPLSSVPPISKYTYAYLLPNDMLHLYGTYPVNIDYARYENYLYTNQSTSLTIEYSFLPEVNKWPAYFKNLMVVTLASYAAMPVTESEKLSEDYSQKALNYLNTCRAIDSQQQPNPVILRDSLLSRKFG